MNRMLSKYWGILVPDAHMDTHPAGSTSSVCDVQRHLFSLAQTATVTTLDKALGEDRYVLHIDSIEQARRKYAEAGEMLETSAAAAVAADQPPHPTVGG